MCFRVDISFKLKYTHAKNKHQKINCLEIMLVVIKNLVNKKQQYLTLSNKLKNPGLVTSDDRLSLPESLPLTSLQVDLVFYKEFNFSLI